MKRGIVTLLVIGMLAFTPNSTFAAVDFEEAKYIGSIQAWTNVVLKAGVPIADALDREDARVGNWEDDLIPLMGIFGLVLTEADKQDAPRSMVEVYDAFVDGLVLVDAATDEGLDALREEDERAFLAIKPVFIDGFELVGAAINGVLDFQQACGYDTTPCDIDAEVQRPDGQETGDESQNDIAGAEDAEEAIDSHVFTGEIRFAGNRDEAWVPSSEHRNGCAGTGAYRELKRGGTIRITDAEGKVLAEPEITTGILSGEICLLTFEVEVPDSDVYVVELTVDDTVVYTRNTMKENNWNVSITRRIE